MSIISQGSTALATIGLIFTVGVLEAQPRTCGDILAGLRKVPPHLEFLSCAYRSEEQGKPFKAEYRVKGKDAESVENYLIEKFHMERLKKSCCQWDGPAATFSRGHDQFQIRMSSDEDTSEVATYNRSDWRKTPYFHVEVRQDTEAP